MLSASEHRIGFLNQDELSRRRGGVVVLSPTFSASLHHRGAGAPSLFLGAARRHDDFTVARHVLGDQLLLGTTNFEVHAPHWHGNVVTAQHMRTDVLNLVTMGMIVADMTPDNPGTWLFHCHVEVHQTGGMSAVFVVEPAGTKTVSRQ